MKNVIALMAFVMMAQGQAYAQQGQQVGQVDQVVVQQPTAKKKTVIYDERSNELVEVAPQVQAEAPKPTAQPIYIMNNQKVQGYQGTNLQAGQQTGQQAAQIQEQPVTVVQEAPLKVSAADNMRKKRVETEAGTEDGIVQALEKARTDDELKRRDRFNNAIAPVAETAVVTQQQAVVVQQQQVVPAPAAAPQQAIQYTEVQEVKSKKYKEEDDVKPVDVRAEVRAALDENAKKNESKSSMYVSGLLGVGQYSSAVNMTGGGSAGAAVGFTSAEHIVGEVSFLAGNYQVSNLYNCYFCGFSSGYQTQMKQYNFAGAVKYQILSGKFRPVVGALLSYTRRSYNDGIGNNFLTSDAIDAGALAGLDFQFSENFGVGADVRYLTNLGSRYNWGGYSSSSYGQPSNVVEKLDYWIASLALKVSF